LLAAKTTGADLVRSGHGCKARRPTTVYRDLISEEATPFLGFAVDLMRRFMPKIRRTLTMATIWLLGQCTIFVRHRQQLSNPPISLDLGEAAVEWLTNLVSAWGIGWTSVRANRCFFPH